ncbi:hypothetical protein [Streptomyces abyssomicinicus]|nr:hypothetical protein [Streptomyces abyssomicinicus]
MPHHDAHRDGVRDGLAARGSVTASMPARAHGIDPDTAARQ